MARELLPRLDTLRCFPYDHVRHSSDNRQHRARNHSKVSLETEAYAANDNLTHDVDLSGRLLVVDDSVRDQRLGATAARELEPAQRTTIIRSDSGAADTGIGDRFLKMGTYVNGRRLPLQGRGWGFESLRAHQSEFSNLEF